MRTPTLKQVSMRRRLTLALTLAMTLVVIVVDGSLYLYNAYKLDKTFSQKILHSMSHLEKTLGHVLWNYDMATAELVAETLMLDDIIAGVTLRDENGEPLFLRTEPIQGELLTRTRSIQYNNKPVGEMDVMFSNTALSNSLADIVWISLVVWAVAVIIITILVNLFIFKYFKGPLDSFINLAESYRQKKAFHHLSATPFIEFQPIEKVVKDLAKDVFSRLEQLQTSEKKYRELTELAQEGIWAFDKEGCTRFVNPSMAKMLGYSLDEMDGKSLFSFMNKQSISMAQERIGRLKQGIREQYDFEFLRKDGNRIFTAMETAPIIDKQGNYKGALAGVIDITERVKAEKETQDIADSLHEIFNSTPNILALINGKGQVQMMNQQGSGFFGKTDEELTGKLIGTVLNCVNSFDSKGCGLNPECADCPVRVRVMSTLRTGRPSKEEEGKMTFLINGEKRLIHLLISTALLEIGDAPRVLLSLTDVTDLKRAEEEIAFQALLLNKIQDHVTATDLQGNILYVNEAESKSLRLSADGLDDAPVRAYGGGTPPQEQIIENTLKQGSWRGEVVKYSHDGREIFMDTRTSLINDENGRPWRMVGIATDITSGRRAQKEKQLLEKQIQQAQKMESIGNLAGGIAHDFNNILFPIIGLSEMLLEDLPPESLEHENVREIFDAGRRGSELVQQILAFSRQSEHKMIPVRIQTVLKEVLKLSRSSIPSNIEIIRDIQPDCTPVMADSTQIHQIAMNLITNAYHAVEEKNGRIDVTLKEIALDTKRAKKNHLRPGRYVILSVTDNGAGIPKEMRNKIFEPYFTTKKQGKGTGLGLAVVFGIVKEHHGNIEVVSEVGKGAAFNIYLPMLEKSENTVLNKETIAFQTGTERILLVDDEIPIVRLEKQMLERLGYDVVARASSADAFEAFKANPGRFDIVITDFSMPYLTGIQLAEKMIEIKPDIPIIICSGFSETISEQRMKVVGIKGVLKKPVVKSVMAKMVRDALDGHAPFGR